MRRLSPATISVGAGVLLGLVGNVATSTVGEIPAGLRPWLWAATATLAVIAVVIEAYRNLADRPRAPTTGPDLAQAADLLAQAVERQWVREEHQRKIHDPAPLPVRWRPAQDQLVDHWVNVHRAPAGSTAGPIAVAGKLDEIAQVYQHVPSGRLVILGPGGAGKTILAARLVLDLLAHRPAGGPVPVIVSIAAWDPATSLADWLADQLVRDHPGLAPTRPGAPHLATALLDAKLIRPVLDGFDEIPPALQRPALRQLNAVPDLPLILTSRPEEYAAAVAGTDVLTAAAGIELDSLSLDDLTDYLPRTTRRVTIHDGHRTDLWNPVLTRLRAPTPDRASIVLRQALSTPLMVYLARTIYSDTPEHNPFDLLDPARFATPEVIEEHLIAAYLPAIYQHPGPSGRTWPAERARHWLAYLARHLDHHHTRDLAWWQLCNTIPRPTRIITLGLTAGLVAGLASGFATGFAAMLRFGLTFGTIIGLAFGLALGLVVGLAFGLPLGRTAHEPLPTQVRLHIRGRSRETVVGLVTGLAVGLLVGLEGGPVAGLLAGLVAGLAIGIASPIDVTAEATPTGSLINDRRTSSSRILMVGVAGGLTGWLVTGHALGLVAGLMGGVAIGLVVGLSGAWGQWLVLVRLWLPLTGQLPWPVLAFLTDARHRGVLRQSGVVYQFRHARLQHHLTRPPIPFV